MHLATCEIECRNSGIGDAFGSSRRLSFKITVEVVLAINQIVIWDWYIRWIVGIRSLLCCHNTFRGIVIPIRLRETSARVTEWPQSPATYQNYRTEVNIVGRFLWRGGRGIIGA